MKNFMKNAVTVISVVLAILFVGHLHAATQDSDIVCTQEYSPVCWMPYFECPDWALCSRPMDVTYSNMCMLDAANATLQHKWVCEHDIPKACSKEYKPVCGETLPKTCLSLDCAVHLETYSNRCTMENAGSTFMYEWECKTKLPEATNEKYYVWDSQKCTIIKYRCDEWYNYFSDSIWCGCEKDPVSPEMKEKIDTALDNFMQKLDSNWYSKITTNKVLVQLSKSLQNMRKSKPKYTNVINYTLQKLDSY